MPIGKLIYRFRSKYGHGLRVAYYRDVVRPRILRTRPVEGLDDESCEIHVLTSQNDWLNLVWALKSFYHCSGRRYRLCIHEDGTLTSEELATLVEHFPAARIIDRRMADERMGRCLSEYPRSRSFRDANPLALKVFDFGAFLESPRMFLLDSDVLFFRSPDELLRRVDDANYRKNTLNRDWRYGYTVEVDEIARHVTFPLKPLVNSGLGLIHRESIDLAAIEHWLGLPGMLSHPHRIEQTLIALYSCRHGFEFLPAEYDVTVREPGRPVPCRHYTGPIRHLMYSRGMRKLCQDCSWISV